MIIIVGGARIAPEHHAEVVAAAAEYARTVRAEDGCVDYMMAWDATDPLWLRLTELWESDAAYQVHGKQPHVAEWGQLMRRTCVSVDQFDNYDAALRP